MTTKTKMMGLADTLAPLLRAGFKEADFSVPRRLIASIAGRPKTGKTHLALTAPPPIIYFDIDIGEEGVLSKFEGTAMLTYEVRVPKQVAKAEYEKLWEDAKTKLRLAWGLGRGTVITDTSTELYELNRLARFGKLDQVPPYMYSLVNTEWRELIREAFDSRMNTIFIHKTKAVWVDNKRTDRYELAGFGEMEYLTQINIETSRVDLEEGGSQFWLKIADCRHNPAFNGWTNQGEAGLFDFSFLINMIHGSEA